jgi:hypothetical protein
MEDRPNADCFTERTSEGRAGFPERCRPRIIDRRPTPVQTDARRAEEQHDGCRAIRWFPPGSWGAGLLCIRSARGARLLRDPCQRFAGVAWRQARGAGRTLAGLR